MKPLELTIHPPAECECFPVENPWTYYGIVEPGGAMEPNPGCPAHFWAEAGKHLTDADMAGECRAAEVEAWLVSSICGPSAHTEMLECRSLTLHRFASTPHYLKEAA